MQTLTTAQQARQLMREPEAAKLPSLENSGAYAQPILTEAP